jgi:hypothetical protein
MRSPRYLYRTSNFIFSYKIGTIFLLLWSFSGDLLSESYSSYLFDDFKAQQDWGRVKVHTKTRNEQAGILPAEGFQTMYQIFTAVNFRSQKGGTNREEANKYQANASGNSEINFQYKSGSQHFSFLIGPRWIAYESRIVDRTRTSVWDSEGIFSYTLDLNKLRLALEGGRGWQRLDGFGFLFNGMANYGQFQIASSDLFSLSLHSLSFKPEEESISPKAWNYERKEIIGGAIRSSDHFFWENIQVFHYIYKEPISSKNPTQIFPSYQFGSFLYSGFEFRSAKFWEDTSIDLSFIRTTGIRKNKTAPWTETRETTNATLGYGSLHGVVSHIFLAMSGLYTSKDKISRTDSENNGFAAPLAEPRVLGGYSSFLLYQSVYFQNDRTFYEFYDKRNPGFENKGQRMIGLQIGYNLFSKTRGDIYLNRSSSEIGNGTEVILKVAQNFESYFKGFLSGSICYAVVDSNKKTIWISEPFTEIEKRKEFLRFYVSAGFQF